MSLTRVRNQMSAVISEMLRVMEIDWNVLEGWWNEDMKPFVTWRD